MERFDWFARGHVTLILGSDWLLVDRLCALSLCTWTLVPIGIISVHSRHVFDHDIQCLDNTSWELSAVDPQAN